MTLEKRRMRNQTKRMNLPLRFLSVILKLSAQKLLLEKILAPSLSSAKMSFKCWSTSERFSNLLFLYISS